MLVAIELTDEEASNLAWLVEHTYIEAVSSLRDVLARVYDALPVDG